MSETCKMITVHAGMRPDDPDGGFVPVEEECCRPSGMWLVEGVPACDGHVRLAIDERLSVTTGLTPWQADGLACVNCGGSEGITVPAGRNPVTGSQLFSHSACIAARPSSDTEPSDQ